MPAITKVTTSKDRQFVHYDDLSIVEFSSKFKLDRWASESVEESKKTALVEALKTDPDLTGFKKPPETKGVIATVMEWMGF